MDGFNFLEARQPLQGDSLPQVPMRAWYSFDRPSIDERLSQRWNHPVVLNPKPLDWESTALLI